MEITSGQVYAKLLEEIQKAEFSHLYQDLRQAITGLERYESQDALLDALGRENSNYDEKDAGLYGLILATRRRDDIGATALTLLLLAVWPMLLLITQRLRALLNKNPDPLAEVYWAFLQELDRPTYDRAWKVGANLSRNTAKRVVKALKAEWQYRHLLNDLQEWAMQSPEDSSGLFNRLTGSESELNDQDRAILAEAAQKLAEAEVIAPLDALFLIGHAIYGNPLKDLAARHGLGYDAAKQRFHRLKLKLRAHFSR